MKEIILASASKRRSQILYSCNSPHRIVISGEDEILNNGKHVSEIVKINAIAKAENVSKKVSNAVIIAADTLVAHNNDIIGKPNDEDEAIKMLERFSGDYLEVYSGVCVLDTVTGKKAANFSKSELEVVRLDKKEINAFFKLLAPYDKAGGFSIEGVGAMLFDNIEGSYFNILGLPMITLRELFKEIGENILDYIA